MPIDLVTPGDPLQIRASDFNEIARTVAFVQQLQNANGALGGDRAGRRYNSFPCKNVADSAFDAFDVVAITNSLFPASEADPYRFSPGFEVDGFSTLTTPWGVLVGPLAEPVGGDSLPLLGEVATAGVVPARVLVNDELHQFAVPVSGETYLESADSGPARILHKAASEGEIGLALIRFGDAGPGGLYPEIGEVVTKVCLGTANQGVTWEAGQDYEVSDSSGQAVVQSTYKPTTNDPVKIKATVVWKDPDYAAGSGDLFRAVLVVDGTEYTGMPDLFVTAVGFPNFVAEKTWDIPLEKDEEVVIYLRAYRVSGGRAVSTDATSKVEIVGSPAGLVQETRQLLIPNGRFGPKICVRNPKGCCDDDDSSGTASKDTSSKSAYGGWWSAGNVANCVDEMSWRGFELDGYLGGDPVFVPKSFRFNMPSFSGWSGTLYTGLPLGSAYDRVEVVDSPLAGMFSGRQMDIFTSEQGFPTLEQLDFNPVPGPGGGGTAWYSTLPPGSPPPSPYSPITVPPEIASWPTSFGTCGYAGAIRYSYTHPIYGPTEEYAIARVYMYIKFNPANGFAWPWRHARLTITRAGAGTPYYFFENQSVWQTGFGRSEDVLWHGLSEWKSDYNFNSPLTFYRGNSDGFLPLAPETALAWPLEIGMWTSTASITMTPNP